MKVFNLFDLRDQIDILDVGAAAINEEPIYKKILDMNIAHLTAIDGDSRHAKKIQDLYRDQSANFHDCFLFDGKRHNVHVCAQNSGMTSLYKPNKKALEFFNGFEKFGRVEAIVSVQTTRLDEFEHIDSVDFLKMDTQGAELEIIKNGRVKLQNCLAMQLEVSYFSLYENQPTFGEVDTYLRTIGFLPHRFLSNKRWSIAPTIFNNDYRFPGNQLLEADVIYLRNPLQLEELTDNQLKKLVVMAHFLFESPDLCVRILIEMEQRKIIERHDHNKYISNIEKFS